MSEEAIETLETDVVESDELETQLETETEEETPEAESEDEVEIVLEGEDEPTSKPTVPLNKHLRVKKRLKGQVAEKDEEKSALERKLEMQDEELKLLQLKLNEGKPKTRPKAEDYDTDEAYDADLDEYYKERARAEAKAEVNASLKTQQTQATQQQQEQKLEGKLLEHYDRVDELKVPDYADTEDKAAGILGDDISNFIMSNHPKSHILMYHFGKNEAKALYFKNLIAEDPGRGLLELGGYADKLKAKPKRSTAPDPETSLNGGGQTNSADAWTRKIEKARTKVAAGTMKMADLLAIKKQAKEAGVKL